MIKQHCIILCKKPSLTYLQSIPLVFLICHLIDLVQSKPEVMIEVSKAFLVAVIFLIKINTTIQTVSHDYQPTIKVTKCCERRPGLQGQECIGLGVWAYSL